MSNKYSLKILYPTSSSRFESDKQYFTETIFAHSMDIKGGESLVFRDESGNIEAIYPTRYTIVESIRRSQ